jgi:hypothetical protein
MDELRQKLGNLTDDEFDALMDEVKQSAENMLAGKTAEKEAILNEIQSLKDKELLLKKEYTELEDWRKKQEISEERQKINYYEIPKLEAKLKNIDNFLKAISNNGTIKSFKDALGNKIDNIPDFREVKTDLIVFDQETILVDEIPAYIPIINEKSFERKGCVFDAIRITTDTYLLSPFAYEFGKENQFVLLTLDQLVLTNLYYITKLKAEYQKEADRQTQRGIDYYYTLPIEKRERNFAQRGYYQSLPVKVKKTITQEDWEALPLAEKEKLDIPVKRYGSKRIASKLEDNKMWVSFHDMYNQFVNPEALRFNLNLKTQVRTPIPLGGKAVGSYGNNEVFEYWYQFRDMMQYKIKDIDFQREEQSDNYKTAIETSFGDSNTKDTLLADFGVLVKRQNGDEINFTETEQIKDSLEAVESVFGNLKDKFLENKIKVSHTGNKLVFARKAIGVYISTMNTIASSNKYGALIFNTVMAHEIAHFIDNKLGVKNGKRYETDNYESLAGKLAFTFRNNMNKPKSQQTDYINATKECFARCLEQHFAVAKYGDDVEIVYSDSPASAPENVFKQDAYVNKDTYYRIIKPLIENFFKENEDFFKLVIKSEVDNLPLTTESTMTSLVAETNEINEIKEAIETLELLLEYSSKKEKKEINEAIEVLQILLD